MKRIVAILAGLCVLSPALGGDLTDGREVLLKSREAIQKVKAVEYRADYDGTEWVQKFVPAVDGTVILGKESKWEIPRFRCDIKIKKYGSEELIEVTAGSDGDVYFLVDPKTKMAHEDMDVAVLGTNARNIQRPVMGEFADAKPFHDILEPDGDAPTIELKGTTKIADHDCYEVLVKGKSPPEFQWFISKTDFLPRKVVRTYEQEGEKGTTELAISDLKINPKLDKDAFKVDVPPGFTKTDEFAP